MRAGQAFGQAAVTVPCAAHAARSGQRMPAVAWLLAGTLLDLAAAAPPAAVAAPYSGAGEHSREDWTPVPGQAANVETSKGPYRPFEDRFAQKPQGHKRAELLWPENRYGYRRFQRERPYHPWAPNSADRNAETRAVSLFALAALASVVAGILASLPLHAEQGETEAQLKGAALFAGLPWLLLTGWVLLVALQHVGRPERALAGSPKPEWLWHCRGLSWYLLLAPNLAALASASQVVHIVQLLAGRRAVRGQPDNDAVRFSSSPGISVFDQLAEAQENVQEAFDKAQDAAKGVLQREAVQQSLLALEVVALLLGAALLGSGGGARCEPEVWWTAVCFTTSALGFLLAYALARLTLVVVQDVELGIFGCAGRISSKIRDRQALVHRRLRNLGKLFSPPDAGGAMDRAEWRSRGPAAPQRAPSPVAAAPALRWGDGELQYGTCSGLAAPRASAGLMASSGFAAGPGF